MRPQVSDDWAELCCKARKKYGNRMAGDVEAGVEVRYTEASIPRDQEDDSPIHRDGGPTDQVTRSLRQRKLEPEDAASHEGFLLNVAVLEIQGAIPNVRS